MNVPVIILECVLFCAFFTAMVFIVYKNKDSAANIHDYPPDIQAEYFKTHQKVDTSYKSPAVIIKKSIALVFFVGLLTLCAVWAGAQSFWQGALVAFVIYVAVGMWDTFFLDWVLFANLKGFRLEGTEHMDKEYHQKWFHLKGFLFPGMLFAVIAAAATGGIIALIF